MNGGYTLIDTSKLDFTKSTGYAVKGIYEKYFNAIKSGKLIVNDNIDNSSPTTTAALLNSSTGVITAVVGENTFTIASDDTVTNS